MPSLNFRTVLPALACVVAGFSSATFAGPTPKPGAVTSVLQYDISFEDGRTQSMIGKGLPNAEGLIQSGDPEDLGPAAFCFDPTNPPSPEMMNAVENAIRGGYGS